MYHPNIKQAAAQNFHITNFFRLLRNSTKSDSVIFKTIQDSTLTTLSMLKRSSSVTDRWATGRTTLSTISYHRSATSTQAHPLRTKNVSNISHHNQNHTCPASRLLTPTPCSTRARKPLHKVPSICSHILTYNLMKISLRTTIPCLLLYPQKATLSHNPREKARKETQRGKRSNLERQTVKHLI